MNTHRSPAVKFKSVMAAALASAAVSVPALAYEAGDWVGRLGAHYVSPRNDNHEVVSVEGSPGVTGSVGYFVAPTLAVDVLLAVPFEHDIALAAGGDTVGSTRHLPPTVSLMWFPRVSAHWQPFVGAGVNYTMFFDEQTRGALDGTHLRLKDSVGAAFVVGAEVALTPRLLLSLDARYFDIDTKAHLDGASLGTAKVDPLGYGVSVACRF